MSNDRELLELAAKAAGIDGKYLADANGGSIVYWTKPQYIDQQPGPLFWDPLTNDGDALRLAVRLEIDIYGSGITRFAESNISVIQEDGDPYAATRRAIVRAAAEIGKTMP